jgi:hypothetical protein
MRYKFQEINGCTAFDRLINGKRESEYSPEEIKEMIDYLLPKVRQMIDENSLDLFALVSIFPYSDFKYDSESCEQCGDSVSETIWEI